jgi:class 3 adenylate cyclase/CheY-like chemotaxis protein
MEGAATVVVVDDEADLRDTVVAYLTRQGLSARGAANATELRAHLGAAPADLVVLDIAMPGEDGLSVARWLRTRGDDVGIVMLTAAAEVLDRVVGLEVGADDYVAKPFDLRELLARLRAVLRRRAAARATASGAAPAGRQPAENTPGTQDVGIPGIDHFLRVGDTHRAGGETEEFPAGPADGGGADPDRVLATVAFTDIVGSTRRAAELGDRRWRALLSEHNAIVRRALARFGGREVQAMGDGFLATFDGPARAVLCARASAEEVRSALGVDIRSGVHTGEVELDRDERGVRGIAVHIAARIAALAGAGEVLVSGTVRDLAAGSGIEFRGCGARALKGVPGRVRLFSAVR